MSASHHGVAESTGIKRFVGSTAIVTGAGAGIGAAIARRLTSEGARVALVDLNADALKGVADSCHGLAAWYVADVTDETQTDSVFQKIVADLGPINVAVLNAGIESKHAPIHEVSLEDFDRVMSVNVRGVFLWLSRCMGHMRQFGKGAITITSSTSGLRAIRNLSPYTTSKHAVIGLMKVAALEGSSHGIRVNCVNPGPIETRMMHAIEANRPGEISEVRAQGRAAVPLGRYGTAEEIAALTAFLCSDDAAFCTGATYLADGGIMAGS